MPEASVVDFYVTSLAHFATPGREWLVSKDLLSNSVGIQDSLEAATAQAIRMTEYYAARGDDVQVHIHAPDVFDQWRTVWHRPDFKARFPADSISEGPG
jgi:hypothetical protein